MFSCVIGLTNRASLSYQKLFNSSFNLPEKYRYSYKSVLSELRKVICISVNFDITERSETTNKFSIVYDLSDVSKKERINYLRFYGIDNNLVFVASDELVYFNSFGHKVWFLFVTFPIQIQLLILGFFKKDISGFVKNVQVGSSLLSRIVTIPKFPTFILQAA
jgi:hypothetical protein